MWVPSLGQEDPLEKEVATHSSILTWRIPGQRSLVGYSPWGHKKSYMTEWVTLWLSLYTQYFVPPTSPHLSCPLRLPSPYWKPLGHCLCLWVCFFLVIFTNLLYFVDSTCKWCHMVFDFLCLTHFTFSMMLSKFTHVAANGKNSFFLWLSSIPLGFDGSSAVKNLPANAGDEDWIPGLEISPREGNILTWEIQWTEEPGRLQSMGSQRSQT